MLVCRLPAADRSCRSRGCLLPVRRSAAPQHRPTRPPCIRKQGTSAHAQRNQLLPGHIPPLQGGSTPSATAAESNACAPSGGVHPPGGGVGLQAQPRGSPASAPARECPGSWPFAPDASGGSQRPPGPGHETSDRRKPRTAHRQFGAVGSLTAARVRTSRFLSVCSPRQASNFNASPGWTECRSRYWSA